MTLTLASVLAKLGVSNVIPKHPPFCMKEEASPVCRNYSSERRVLDLESEVNEKHGFYPHWG